MVTDPARDLSNPMEDMTQGMAELLQEEESLKSLRRGDIIEGVVMHADRESILVDISSKTEGVIPAQEMRSLTAEELAGLSVGDPLLVYVLNPENQEGQVVLSLDRASGERGWRTLQTRFEAQDIFEAEVVGYNKGGLLVNIEGIRGFVPSSQVVGLRADAGDGDGPSEERLAEWIGKTLRLKIIELNRRRNRLILSERVALQEWRTQQKDRLLSELQEGAVTKGVVTSIRPFGVFVDIGGADGLIHLSELTWGRNQSPEEIVAVGQEVEVFILKVDPDTKKIALSLRRAQPQAWDSVADAYQVGQSVRGTITKLTNFGAFAHIDGPVEGLIHISELADRRITHPKEVVKEGDVLTLKIIRIEKDRHRLGLSLRQAIEEAEQQERVQVRQQVESYNRGPAVSEYQQADDRGPTLGDALADYRARLEEMGRESDR